ncbi:MAG TPA: tetratricopeptide repeat protein [Spirochaetota bacterium]|nr:tetratricopeptide repeat protein [Spirochaetota bacterium]
MERSDKKTVFISITVLACIITVVQCSKDDAALLDRSMKISEKAPVNRELRKLKESVPSAKDDFERSEIHQKISEIESDKGDTANAIRSARESIKYYPNQARAHYLLGKSYLASGRLDDAETELRRALELDERLADAHFEMGNLKYKRKQYPGALSEYEKTVKLDPKNFQAFNNMGVINYQLNRPADAEKALLRVVALRPDFAAVYKNLGIIYELKLKDTSRAREYYTRYLEKTPGAPDRNAVKLWIANLGK